MAFLSGAFAWVSNAVKTATNTVKKVISTVKKANDIVESVNNASVNAVRQQVTKSSQIQKRSTWVEDYDDATARLEATIEK